MRRRQLFLCVLLVATATGCFRAQQVVLVPPEGAPCVQTCAAQHRGDPAAVSRCCDDCPGAVEANAARCDDPRLPPHASCSERTRVRTGAIVGVSVGATAAILLLLLVSAFSGYR